MEGATESMAAADPGAIATRAAEPRADRFTKYPSIDHRYKEQGASRWQSIDRDYVVSKTKMVKLKNEKGMRITYRHRLNSRKQMIPVQKIVKKILQKGANMRCRGVAYVKKPRPEERRTDDPEEMHAAGAGTLIDACYVAEELEPENLNVQRIMREGIGPCHEIHEECPDDIIEWIKDELNDYHEGSGFNCAEQYELHARGTAAWERHCDENSLTWSSCPKTGEFRFEKKKAKGEFLLREVS
jgi:NAD-dependent dihydropyrimidine dehydrogenase PreA subunit